MTEVNANDPAVARKRRKAIIQSQRSEAEQPVVAGNAVTAPSEDPSKGTKRKTTETTQPEEGSEKEGKSRESFASHDGEPAESGKKKTQIRYDPDVPMSKEQLAAWRREARRVRNRESAAASRQRIRNRITELEDEVQNWKSKYAEAMERLQVLERSSTAPARSTHHTAPTGS